uniref:(California timema) hypothetical protein n=1 Tax=Timema californicum TaxID=61474 RepID=A0A7R9JBN1_TIMCA|nr:unnamed protein product [Timema californicum]
MDKLTLTMTSHPQEISSVTVSELQQLKFSQLSLHAKVTSVLTFIVTIRAVVSGFKKPRSGQELPISIDRGTVAQLPANTRPTVASRTSGRCPPLNLTDSIYKGKHLGKIHTHLSKILNSFKLEKSVPVKNKKTFKTCDFQVHSYLTQDKMMLATPWLLAVFLAVAALASPSPAINEIRQPSNKPGRFLSLPVPNKCAQREYQFIVSTLLLVHDASWQGFLTNSKPKLLQAQEAVVVSGWPHEQYTELSVAQEPVVVSVPPGMVGLANSIASFQWLKRQ